MPHAVPGATPPTWRAHRVRRTALSAAVGLLSSLATGAPADAADPAAPTISVTPTTRTGFGPVTISGAAQAGAQVHLYESAYNWNDLQHAPDWDTADQKVSTTASSAGKYQFTRNVDTGFIFAVEVNGVLSATALVIVQVQPTLTVTSTQSGTVVVNVSASPNQPYLAVEIERANSTGSYSTVADGFTDNAGTYSASLTGQGAGTTQTYRAWISGDTETGVTANHSTAVRVKVAGTATPPSTAAGAVQFTRIQYNSPGKDTGSNTSVNGEQVRLTNRTKKTINLRSWTVRDAAGHVYAFTGDYSLGASREVYLHTGKGANGKPSGHRYWGSASYVWNNGGDSATLRDSAGKTVDTCTWTTDKSVTSC
jgi:hypothetical protein